MRTKFTPGPWEAIAPDPDSPCKAVTAHDERFHESTRTICVVAEPHRRRHPAEPDYEETGEEDQANTVLIAMAPELYAALNDAYGELALLDAPVSEKLLERLASTLRRADGEKA